MKAWKVTYKCKSSHIIFASKEDSPFILKYRIGIETLPKVGKLFVFDSLYAAVDWTSGVFPVIRQDDTVIFEGIAKGISRAKWRSLTIESEYLKEFWRMKATKKVPGAVCPIPLGTALCKSFVPIKSFTYEEAYRKVFNTF